MTAAHKNARILFSLLAAFVISGGFLFSFLKFGDSEKVFSTLGLAGSGIWFACLFSCLACAFIRYLRLQTVVKTNQASTLLRISAWHGAAIALFPARLGELVLPWLTRRAGLSSFVSGLGVLILLRALDLAAIIFIGSVGYLAIGGVTGVEWAILAALAGGLVLTPEIFIAVGRVLGARDDRKMDESAHRVSRLVAQLSCALSSLSRAEVYNLVAQTMLLWVMLGVASVVALGGVAKELDFGAATLGLAGGSLAFALPVNGVASAGPFEAAYAFAAGLAGTAQVDAISAAIILHICAVASAILFVLLAEIAARLFLSVEAVTEKKNPPRETVGKEFA